MSSYTSLNARVKISKSHPVIELRGKLDSINAQIIFLQTLSSNQEYISDLEDVRKIINALQKCEAGEKVFDEKIFLFGMSEDEIHEKSHNPKKYFGIGHILPHFEMGREAAGINLLRTLTREAEIISCRAYDSNDKLKIIHALNRLSSALYVLMFKYLPTGYDKVLKFGGN